MSELYGKLRTEKDYARTAPSSFRILRRIDFCVNKEKYEKCVPKKYDTLTDIGVKYSPTEC